MATIAECEANEIEWAGQVFDFAANGGSRQVTAAEREILERYMDNGGPAKVTFREEKVSKSK